MYKPSNPSADADIVKTGNEVLKSRHFFLQKDFKPNDGRKTQIQIF